MSLTRLGPGGFPVQNQFNAQSLTPSLHVDADGFVSATVASINAAAPVLLSDSDGFFSPIVSASADLVYPGLFIDGDIFPVPRVLFPSATRRGAVATVEAENRFPTVESEDRMIAVDLLDAEDRVIVVELDDRMIVVEEENRFPQVEVEHRIVEVEFPRWTP